MGPTVSVIIPTFNRGTLLHNAIQSVLAQTYRNCEVIIIDDGSTDDTKERVKPYLDQVQYHYQNNRGASAAQNRGIELARGEWIAILGDDDLWLPEKLKRQIEAITVMGSEFGACFTDHVYVGDSSTSGSVFERLKLEASGQFGELRDSVYYIVRRSDQPRPILVQSLLIRSSLIRELGGFDESLILAEDTDFILRMSLKTRICFVPEVLVKVDRTPGVPRLTNHLSQKSDELFLSAEHLYKKWLSLPEFVDPSARALVRERLRNMYYEWAIRELKNHRVGVALNKIKASGDSYSVAFINLAARKCSKLVTGLTSATSVRSEAQS